MGKNTLNLTEAVDLMNLVSEQFGGFRICFANGDSMKIADVMFQVAVLLGTYDDDVDHFRKRAEHAELAGAQAMVRHAKDMADIVAIVHDIITGKTPGKAPGLDLVEVVRCKDCRLWKRIDETTGKCPFLIGEHQYAGSDHFCSLGERKEDEENE